jgi:hypothetical protein
MQDSKDALHDIGTVTLHRPDYANMCCLGGGKNILSINSDSKFHICYEEQLKTSSFVLDPTSLT